MSFIPRSRWGSICVVPFVGITLLLLSGVGADFGDGVSEPSVSAGSLIVTNLQARFRATSVTTVAGRENTFEDVGRVYFDLGDLCVIREAAGLAEMQLLYVDGACFRYFPLIEYGHRIPPGCLDKQQSDFGRFWRPFLAHLSPESYVASLPDVADGPVVERAGESFPTIVSDPDQAGELRARGYSFLNYWGPVPDIRALVSQGTSRITAVESVVHKDWIREGGEVPVEKHTSARLENFVTIGGESVPTRIVFEERRPGQVRPSRRTVVELSDVRVDEALDDDAFRPLWPDDYIFLDAENRGPEYYLSTGEDPVSMIELAEYYFGTRQPAEGQRWLDAYSAWLGGGELSVSEVSHLARLYSLSGDGDRGRALHEDAVDRAVQGLAAATSREQRVALERRLARLLGEYGFFIAQSGGGDGSGDKAAAAYLESRIGWVSSAEARSRLLGRVVWHHARAGDSAGTLEALSRATGLVGQDVEGMQWLAAFDFWGGYRPASVDPPIFTDPCENTPDDPCCQELTGIPAPCCNSIDPCCGSTDPCCGDPDPCCGDPDPCCPVDCDDGDPCTSDTCLGGNCYHNDDDPCCDVVCDDGDPCTSDSCVDGNCLYEPITCDDGDDCTSDACVGGNCQHDADPCCNVDCDDGDPCTSDSCVGGNCQHDVDPCCNVDCDDGDPCTSDSCVGGSCQHDGDPCCGVNCLDSDPCTLDYCFDGDCQHDWNPCCDEGYCADGDPCTYCSTPQNGCLLIDKVNLAYPGVTEIEEEFPGGVLRVNGDDDNDNGTADKDELGLTWGEDDLFMVYLIVPPYLPGTVTLSTPAGGSRIKVYELPDRSIPITMPASWDVLDKPLTVFVEGIEASVAPRDVELKLEFDGCEDIVNVTVMTVDLDVDSDNSNGFGPPDRSDVEEDAEDLNPFPGKLVGANTRNIDDDSVPDFADGYDLDGEPGTDDDLLDGVQFVPMVLDLGNIDWDENAWDEVAWDEIDPELVQITFEYSASDPKAVEVDDSFFEPAPGHLRLWSVAGSEARNGRAVSDAQPGHFIPAGAVTAADLGFGPGVTTVTIWVEGIAPTLDQTNDLITVTCSLGEITYADAVRVRVYDLELVTFDEETGDVVPTESVSGPSHLAPELTISLTDARVAENGDLVLTVSGRVQDRLSELADDPAQRLQEVQFYVNGALVDVVGGLPALSPGSGIMPWQPYLLDVVFSRTITVGAEFGLARPRGINLVARTSPNAAGHVATDRVEAAIQWWLLEDLLPPTGSAVANPQLTLAFLGEPDPASIDFAWAYIGDREPLPTDGILTEEAPDTGIFSGDLLFLDDGAAVPCTVAIEGDLAFSPDDVDVFTATATYAFSASLTYSAVTTWTETAADSLRFLQDTILVPNATPIGDDPEGPSYAVPIVAVAQDVDFAPEGPNGWIARYAVRATGLDDESAVLLSGVVNGIDVPTEPFAYSPVRYYFVREADHSRPRIFVITVEDLPVGIDAVKPDGLLISDDEIRELDYAIRQADQDPCQFIRQELFEDDFGPPPDEIGEPSEEPVTLPVLLTYFRLMYGDVGLDLLTFFQNGGGVILLGDVLGDLDVDYWTASVAPIEIEIEEDIDPVTAAQYLLLGLRKCLPYQPVVSQIDPGTDLDYWIEAYRARGTEAAAVTAAVANMYYSGIGMVNEGADWVLTIDELRQGHWEAAIGFLPLLPAVVGTSGRVILKKASGEVLETFDGPVIQAIKAAADHPTFAARWDALLDSGLTHQQAKRLVHSGFIRPNQSRKALRNAMLAIGDLPPSGMDPLTAQVHHELSWGGKVNGRDMRNVFADWGFEVSNPQFGHWVVGSPQGRHQSWSDPWRQEWESFMTALDNNSPPLNEGREAILSKLQQMRQKYKPGGIYETGNPLDVPQ